MRFKDRTDAGKKLAQALKKYQNQDGVVYALPRGGVVLGAIVARDLHMSLDLLIPRKIGHPLQPEYAICAVVENGEIVCNQQEVARVDPQWFRQEVEAERQEARRRRELYLGGRDPAPVAGKTAIIVDDGIATGLTMEVSISDARRRHWWWRYRSRRPIPWSGWRAKWTSSWCWTLPLIISARSAPTTTISSR